MTVQLIRHRKTNGRFQQVIVTALNSPNSLDEFDIDVIDLTAADLWHSKDNVRSTINDINDFKSLQKMVEMKSKAKVLYVLPINHDFLYHLYGSKYIEKIQIKDNITILCNNILSKVLPESSGTFNLVFEPTKTSIDGATYPADFFFSTECKALTRSDKSDKITTIELEKSNVYATTLQIVDSEESLLQYIYALFSPRQASPEPEWMRDFTFFNDDEQKKIINNNKDVILSAEEKIADARISLQKNARFKSILYTNGDELVEVVFEMLESLLDYDLSDFVDEKNEDFLIEKEGLVFIGEIKGISSNVKNQNVSQVEVHYQSYIDKLPEERSENEIHQLLIINPLRNTPLDEREPINEKQINLAKRNGCLIIETKTLLKVYENFLRERITSEKCINVFSSHTGLLKMSDFD